VSSFDADLFVAVSMAVVALTAHATRQVLMPAINRATELGQKTRFS
jgi:hypothetical protein